MRATTHTRRGGCALVVIETACQLQIVHSSGPLFVTTDGKRLDRHCGVRIVRRVTGRARISKQVGPHTLRHAFITAALDAGIPLRDV